MISDIEKKLAGIIPWGNNGGPHCFEHNVRPNHIDLSLNFNSIPHKPDTAIIVTSWWGHLVWLRNTLKNYRLTGKYVICSYDPPYDIYDKITEQEANMSLPDKDIWLLPHSWVFKHRTYDTKKRTGWYWDVRYAQGIINQFDNFKWVFTVNGDCVWEKPEGVNDLIKLLEDNNADIMAISSYNGILHTCATLYRIDAFNKVFNFMAEKHRVYVLGSYSPETLLSTAVKKLKLKEFIAPKQPMELDNSSVDHYSRYSQNSTWKEIVGYRNLGAEYISASVEGREPVEKEYVDLKYLRKVYPHDNLTLRNYYETGDRRWLYKMWDENEDSWYDRIYYPIEYYGNKEILNKEDGNIMFENKII